ncbi:hypothetical protein FA13DRAFT_1807982 [Coprinellus micaceus]|uniref:Integral membrane protein n=1 Tax=Coprinellus micaceus TaxID=71717 RepID=A0A4Y7TZD3_COPMI|nr:hypothetical protein FA13DRAFT_1807982 [Coprinellus micaceus]
MKWPDDKSPFWYDLSDERARYDVIEKTSAVVLALLGNGMLLYRCYIVWYHRRWLLLLPVLTYIATIPMAILNIFTGTSILNFISLSGGFTDYRFIAAWFILSVATNILATGLISFRLISAHRRLTKSLGAKQSKIYTGIVAILVESSLPFAISGVVASATVRSYLLFPGFANVWYAFAALSPQFIIYRVVREHAWARDLEERATEMQVSRPIAFATRPDTTATMDTNT